MRVLVVGLNPSRSSPDESAFHPDTISGSRIRQWLSEAGYDSHFVMYTNLSDKKTEDNSLDKSSIGDVERHVYSKMPDIVIAAGKTVSEILTKRGIRHIAVPHPSGLNRNLNDPKVIADTISLLRASLQPSSQTSSRP